MNWLVENWFLLLAAFAIVIVAVTVAYKFFCLPTEKQKEKISKWLIYAVVMAEKELGEKTGALKLGLVYDWFLQSFPWLARLITFEEFSKMVDDALTTMRKMLESNTAVQELIKQ